MNPGTDGTLENNLRGSPLWCGASRLLGRTQAEVCTMENAPTDFFAAPRSRAMTRPMSKVAPQWWDYTTLEPRNPGRCGAAHAQEHGKAVPARFRVVMYDTHGGVLSGRGAGIHHRLEAVDRRQPGGHLRPHRADRAASAGRAAGQRIGAGSPQRRISGAWTNGSTAGPAVPTTHPLSFEKADRELCFQSHSPQNCACRTRTCTFPTATCGVSQTWDAGALRGDARRAGGREALGLQRSAPAQGQIQRRPALARGISQARRRAWSICTR